MTVTAGPQDAPAPPELAVSSLTVRFGALTALDDVSLTVRAGECVAVAGENGAGKTTLIRAVAGDVTPVAGAIELGGRPLAPDPIATARLGVRIVWQDLALANNLDIASNIMLGNERRRHLFSSVSLHNEAARVLAQFGIPIHDTTRSVKSLSGGQRQMVAVARAMAHTPRILLLDEPTASLGVRESDLVERLITRLREQGTTILLSCHDIGQMFRLADRIVVLRHGGLVAEVSPSEVHPDDVTALVSGQKVDSSARRQLTRLHGLAGRLVSSDPSSSLSLILSALGAAIGSERLCMHLLGEDGMLHCAASLGVPGVLLDGWDRLPANAGGGPAGTAAKSQQPVIEDNIPARPGSWGEFGTLARSAKVASSWSVPVLGPGGLLGVITVFRSTTGKPQRDDLDLAGLYAGYAASAVERDRLLDQVTARNRVLETIREVLQSLAGPLPAADGLGSALHALRGGLGASETALITRGPDGTVGCRAYAGPRAPALGGTVPGDTVRGDTVRGDTAPEATLALARAALDGDGPRGSAFFIHHDDGDCLGVTFTAPDGPTVLLATWPGGMARDDRTDLLEDAAHSLRLALEREKALAARQEALALRQSRDMQHAFLRRLSHELRTPLTAITGYASSLLQRDVTWDADTQQRFLSRIAAESSRLGPLVNDLLDFSAIESGIFRLECDWCDLPLVIDAAVAVLPPECAPLVEVKAAPGLPAIWADHDRLEQVFVNLLGNALAHNPPGTRVRVTAEAAAYGEALAGARTAAAPSTVTVKVADDGDGMSPELLRETADGGRPVTGQARKRGAGAGLGLSIAKGIVTAHGGSMELEPGGAGHVLPDQPAGRDGNGALVTDERDRPDSPPQTRVLIVEDDPNIVDLIRSNLAVRGFDTLVSTDGSKVLALLETEQPDMVLLDLMLPEADGFELCRQIRERSTVAIIVVSARGGERDKVTALNMGADDYMTKPFGIEELLARILATLRRTRPAEDASGTPSVIRIGDVQIDLAAQRVLRAGAEIHLTPTEFALLRELVVNRGKLLSRTHLLRRVWGRGYETETEYVRVYIRRLRAKLEPPGSSPLILTQPRAGYRIAAD